MIRKSSVVPILFHFCHKLLLLLLLLLLPQCTGKFAGGFYRIMSHRENSRTEELNSCPFLTATVMPTALSAGPGLKWIRMKNTERSSAESTAGLIFCVKLTLNDRLVGTTAAERNQGKNILVSHQCIS